ncbi:MAG TPA: DNA repair protein RecO [Candidatus Paceibacterota bacterium]|nr:DNA repair protein RecO [Candidatus Paceibacterota bacterium]
MHYIYHTEGLILGSRNYGETGKYYYIFTRDLGMIFASAQGVRKMESKLRFVLQDFSYVKIDFVKGKDFWRITSASKTNELENVSKKRETLEVFANISRLLIRLLAGEEANEILFDDLLNGLFILEKCETNNNEVLRNIEAVIVLRILNNLGYIGGGKITDEIIKSPFEQELVFKVSKNRTKILSEINRALRESHL